MNSSRLQKLQQALTCPAAKKQQPKHDDATAAALEKTRAAVATQEHMLHCAKLELQKAKHAAQKRLYLNSLPTASPVPSMHKLDEGKQLLTRRSCCCSGDVSHIELTAISFVLGSVSIKL